MVEVAAADIVPFALRLGQHAQTGHQRQADGGSRYPHE